MLRHINSILYWPYILPPVYVSKIVGWVVNSVALDQMPGFEASDHGSSLFAQVYHSQYLRLKR